MSLLSQFLRTAQADSTAIHTDVASEISGLTHKASPATGDFILIEDSASGNAKRYSTVGEIATAATSGMTNFNLAADSGTAEVVDDAETLTIAGGANVNTTVSATNTVTVTLSGVTLNADTDISANGWVLDEDNMASDDATKVPTQQSVKAYVDGLTGATSGMQIEIDAIETGAGLGTNGSYTANGSANYISSATSLKNADDLLDAQVKTNADSISGKVDKAGDTMSGNLVMGGNSITGLGAPTGDNDAVRKIYVDAAIAGLSWKNSVVAATTANFDLSTGGTANVDGVSISAGDRILVLNQTSAAENGVYIAAAGAWSRATDFDEVDEINGAAVYVEQGSTYADAGFTVTSNVVTLGTDAITLVQFNGASGITAGTGLSKTGNTLDVNLGAGISETPSDEVGIDTYVNGGLFTTTDGTSASSVTGAQLAINLDGSTLSLGANGIKVSDTIVNEIDAIESGAGLSTTGAYVANGSANYISGATNLKHADDLLDAQIKQVADSIDNNKVVWQTKSATYTMVAGDKIIADTSGGAWTITLPGTPAVGDQVQILDATGDFATNNLTVARNGSNIMGLAEDMACDMADEGFLLVYANASEGWKLEA